MFISCHPLRSHSPGGSEPVRLLFLDFSSAFNTIIRQTRANKLLLLGVGTIDVQLGSGLVDGQATVFEDSWCLIFHHRT